MFIENGVQKALTLGLLLVVGAYLMFRTDPLLAALAFSFVPFVGWRATRTGLFLRLTWTRLQQRMSILTRTIEENLNGVRVVRAICCRTLRTREVRSIRQRRPRNVKSSHCGQNARRQLNDFRVLPCNGTCALDRWPSRHRRAHLSWASDAISDLHDDSPNAGAADHHDHQYRRARRCFWEPAFRNIGPRAVNRDNP